MKYAPQASVCSVLLAITALAQAPQPIALQSDGTIPKFSSTSNLVIVDVTVKGKSGNPIENLKASDFIVTEDGKPQKIAVFEFQKLTDMPEPPPLLALSDQMKLPEAPKTTITAETPGQVQYHNKRLMVFYFDFSSMGIPEQLRAQEAAMEYLDDQDHQGRHRRDPALFEPCQRPHRFHRRPRPAYRHHQNAAHRRDDGTGGSRG